MRGVPTVPFYMITAICKAKIFTAFFTANQSTKANLQKNKLYFDNSFDNSKNKTP